MSEKKIALEIKNLKVSYGAIQALKGIDLTVYEGDVVAILGANGAGKSNFIRFFEMLSWMLRGQKLQEFVLRNGEGDDQLFMGSKVTPSMDAEIRLETSAGFNDYRFTLSHVAGNRLILEKEAFRFSSRQFETESDWIELPMPSTEAVIVERMQADQHGKTAAIVVNLLKNCATYQFHDTSAGAQIKMPWDVEDNLFLRSNGGNLAPILLRLQSADIKRYKLIVRQISRVLPFFGDFVLEPAYGKVKLRWTGKGYDKTFGPDLTSDGSLRLFCLLTLLSNSRTYCFWMNPSLACIRTPSRWLQK